MLSRIARALYQIGRDVERAENVARILEVNHKMNLETAPGVNVWTPILEAFGLVDAAATEATVYEQLVLSGDNPRLLLLNPEEKGSPVDLHQWQALLRSLSAYQPYRSLCHARIVPAHVLEFLVTNPSFPRSFHYGLHMVYDSLRAVGSSNLKQMEVRSVVSDLLEELRDPSFCTLMLQGDLKRDIERLGQRCADVSSLLEEAYFNLLKVVDSHGRETQMASQMPQ